MPGSCSASELTVLTLNQQNSVNRPGKDGTHRTIDQINQILLPHSVALESYVKAFQYKVINSIFIQIPNYVKLVTEATICVYFVKLSQKLQIIFL